MTDTALPDPRASLGAFLRDRRERLQPTPGVSGRRRTPGLRREEVALRAGVSVTWYTWLEQGRGGPPSEAVLERLSAALELDAPGREMLFLLAQHRPPPLKCAESSEVDPAVQRFLDSLATSPAFVKTRTWDVVAWNAAAVAVLGDYAALPARDRNGLRRLFCDPAARTNLPDWEEIVRFVVGVFRVDVARMGVSPEAERLVAELQAASADFRRLWAETDVRAHGFGLKRFHHPIAGPLMLEHAAFSIDGAEGLTVIVYTPVSSADVLAIEQLLTRREQAA
jgi:transcriptional regulator with XRE-family HTH domain